MTKHKKFSTYIVGLRKKVTTYTKFVTKFEILQSIEFIIFDLSFTVHQYFWQSVCPLHLKMLLFSAYGMDLICIYSVYSRKGDWEFPHLL